MSSEIEAAVVDGSFAPPVGAPRHRIGRAKPHHVVPVGAPCPNCQAVLQGPWCHACGQSAADLHRSIRRLATSAFEDLAQFDGRFWRTAPRLVLKPGELTREYIAGRRASQIPPLRMFLIALLVVFFAGSWRQGPESVIGLGARPPAHPGKPAAAKPAIVRISADQSPGAQPAPGKPPAAEPAERADQAREAADRARGRAEITYDVNDLKADLGKGEAGKVGGWIERKARSAGTDPAAFREALDDWGHRFAILALPISAVILSILFVFQRRFYVFDHLVFSMHSLAFQGFLLSPVLAFGGVWNWLLWLSPVHLFVHMRGAYTASVFGTLVRMTLLFFASSIAFAMLVLAVVVVGLAAIKG